MIWTEKYRPKNLEEIKGQDEVISIVKNFLNNFGKKKNALILHGPPGTGKTTIVHATAKEINAEIFELNASDFRNKEKLKGILRPAIEQQSLEKKNKLILIDEVDGVSETDYGGVAELLRILQDTKYPLIMTANNIWNKKFSELRKKCEMAQLKELDRNIIKNVLTEIAKKENLKLDDDFLTELSNKSKGDLRAAINDLQTFSKIQDYFPIIVDERNKETDIFNSLKKIFKEKPSKELIHAFDSVNISIDELLLWMEENIPAEYQNEELARAYYLLSKTDIFKGRIYKQQYWRFLIYENFFLTFGIASSKKNPKPGFTSYKRPSRILKIWLNNQKTVYKKSISQKYSSHVHIGQKRAMSEFPVIKQILKTNPEIQKELKLEEPEIEYLRL
jgi:replication factor C large subunit